MRHNQIREYRNQQLKAQKNLCPLCGKYIKQANAALDHCHATGHVRMVLHKNCNSIEGRILHWAKRSGVRPDTFLRRLAEYWDQDFTCNRTHPTHKTEDQKEILRLKRIMKKVKKPETKARYAERIKELQ
jgi:hypothetical protein